MTYHSVLHSHAFEVFNVHFLYNDIPPYCLGLVTRIVHDVVRDRPLVHLRANAFFRYGVSHGYARSEVDFSLVGAILGMDAVRRANVRVGSGRAELGTGGGLDDGLRVRCV